MLFYFTRNDGRTDIEIIEVKHDGHKRKHLNRITYPHLKAIDIRPGAKLVIFGKQFHVVDYEDKVTRDALGAQQSRCGCTPSLPRAFALSPASLSPPPPLPPPRAPAAPWAC